MRPALAAASACAGVLLAGCGTAAVGASPHVEGADAERIVARQPAADPSALLGGACVHPDGAVIHFPADWSVNAGDTLPACSWFDPDPFTVPEATDVRAAITVGVEEGFDAATALADVVTRRSVQVDGRDGVRAEQVAGAGLYPEGTPITTYAVDLGDGRTLVATTVGLEPAEHAGHVRVLDAMMESIELDGTGRL